MRRAPTVGLTPSAGHDFDAWQSGVDQAISVFGATKSRQDRRVLDAHGLQRMGVESQRFEDRRRDLRGCYRRLDCACTQMRMRDDQANVGVAEAESAVFRILL